MKILVVSGSFYPENSPRSFRTTELVKEFSRLGHEVVVYVPEYECDYSDFLKSYSNVKLHQMNCVNEKRTFIISEKISYLWFRFKNLFFESPYLPYYFKLKKVLENECGYDLLVSVAVPHPIHWGIGRIYKKRKIAETWAADCGDPFMLCASVSMGKMFYFKWFEKLWCRKCDYITIPTAKAVNGYYPEFREKIRVIPQAFNFDEIVLDEYVHNPVPTFAYFGRFVKGNTDPRPLLDYLLSTGKDFRFIVFSKQKELFSEYYDICGEKLILRDFLPRLEAIREMSKMDFLLYLPYKDDSQKPSKLIDYTLSGRPILTVYPYNIDTSTIDEFLNGNYSNQTHIDDIENYNIKNVAQQFINLC